MKENFEDFKSEYDKLYREFPGLGLENPKAWFDKVQKTHAKIREKIGGITVEKVIRLNSVQRALKTKKATEIVNEIIQIAPHIISETITKESLFWPSIRIHNRKAIRTTKYLSQYRGYIADYTKRSRFDRLISKLGEEYVKAKTTEVDFTATLNTSAISFAKLGHYKVDEGSCFRNEGEREDNKYIIGQSPDTFVMTISKGKDLLARLWGFATNGFKTYNTCNVYFAETIREGDILGCLTSFFADSLGVDEDAVRVEEDMILEDDSEDPTVYINDYGRRTFTIKEFPNCDFDINSSINLKKLICHHCEEEIDQDDEFKMVDGEPACLSCADEATYCYMSGIKTFKDTFKYSYNLTAIDTPEHRSLVEECGKCHKLMLPSQLFNSFDTSDKKLCDTCLHTRSRTLSTAR